MATYKQPIINPEHLFKWEPDKKFLFFITQGAHISGTAMKQLLDRIPEVVDLLVQRVNASKPTIGTALHLGHDGQFTFIVSRKHYNSKHDLDLVSSALASLSGDYKMFSGEFPTIVNLVTSQFTNIDLRKIFNHKDAVIGYNELKWTPSAATISFDK